MLTLLVIPTFYEIMDHWREGLLARLGLGVAHRRHVASAAGAEDVSGGVIGAPLPGGAPGD